MKILFGLACVTVIAYVVALVMVPSEEAKPEEKDQPMSWPLGDPRMRGFASAFKSN